MTNSSEAKRRRVRRFNRAFDMKYNKYQCALYAGIEGLLVYKLWRSCVLAENGDGYYD